MKHAVKPDRVFVSGPWITQKEIDYVTDAVTHAWYANANVFNDRFEKAFAAYEGVSHAIALPSCTSAIHLALLAAGVGPGDEVIVPEITWIASAAPVTYVGAETVFADVDRATWCLSPESFEACITPRTKAVIPVDLYGSMADYDRIREIAARHGIMVIEDAAEAAGAEYHGAKAGSIGHVGVFSFHGSKILTTGEGGMLLTDDEEIYRRALFLRDHGRKPGDRFFFNAEVAYKYKMSSMQAALGLAQLERIDELVAKKRQIFGWYRDRLGGLEGVALNAEPSNTLNTYWMVSPVWSEGVGPDKVVVMERLTEKHIDTRPFFFPLSGIPAYAGRQQAEAAKARNTVAYAISPYAINLPSGLDLTEEIVDYVCDAFVESLRI